MLSSLATSVLTHGGPDMDKAAALQAFPLADSNGLPLWRGAQVAVDITFVSPVSRDGFACAGAEKGRRDTC